jgi:hypothetical protein
MKISIISPTLQRESLVAWCESVNRQEGEWQHIVVVDCFELNLELMERIKHPQRVIVKCDAPHCDWGNTCRRNGWNHAVGEYVVYLDDDNFFSPDPLILRDIEQVITAAGCPPFCLFPIVRHGSVFFYYPPALCMTDTANLVLRRDVGQWPDVRASTADGILAEYLLREHGCTPFPDFRPIIHMPSSSRGKSTREGEGMEW